MKNKSNDKYQYRVQETLKNFQHIVVSNVDSAVAYLGNVQKELEDKRVALIADLDEVFNEGISGIFKKKLRKKPNMLNLELDFTKISDTTKRIRENLKNSKIIDMFYASNRPEEYEKYRKIYDIRASIFHLSSKILKRKNGPLFEWRKRLMKSLRRNLNPKLARTVNSFSLAPEKYGYFKQYISNLNLNQPITSLITNCGKSTPARLLLGVIWEKRKISSLLPKRFPAFLDTLVEKRYYNTVVYIDSAKQTLDEITNLKKRYTDLKILYLSVDPGRMKKLT